MKYIDKDLIDSLVERQSLIDIINYPLKELEQKKVYKFWYDHFVKKHKITKDTQTYRYFVKTWRYWTKYWTDKKDNYVQKSNHVSWYQDKEYLKSNNNNNNNIINEGTRD